jgi:hypothetical protein
MQRVDFFQLSRPVQDRFIGCARGESQPAALLYADADTPRDLPVFAAIATGGMLALAVLLRWGFGDSASPVAIQPPVVIALYALAFAACFAGGLRVVQRLREGSALPFRAGVYLFPSAVIDARRAELRIFSVTTLVESGQKNRTFAMTFADGTAFALPVRDPVHAEQIDAALRKGREALTEAIAAEDKKRLGQLDPLQDIGMANPFAPKTSMVPRSSVWVRRTIEMAILSAILVAPLFWFARNRASDFSMFRRANRDRSAEAFRAYLAAGGRDSEVRATLLPRAELSEAVHQGSVDAIEKYKADHPDTRIGPDVTSALRQAMLAELEQAKKPGTVTALTEFATRHPNHLVDSEWGEAVHDVYQRAFANYTKRSGVRDAAVLGFMQDLLSFAEKSGPKVAIRFRGKSTRAMEGIDRKVKKNHHYTGPDALPSQYFDDDHERPREKAAAQVLIDHFAAVFPADVLSFEVGPPLNDPAAPLAAAGAPTMFIEHSAEPSGALYFSPKPRGVFAGVSFAFELTWLIPGVAKPFQLHAASWRPPRPKAAKGAPDPVEGAVYDAMAEGAFAQLTRKCVAIFFPSADLSASN